MDLETIRKKKTALEKGIAALIKIFEASTKVQVTDVEVQSTFFAFDCTRGSSRQRMRLDVKVKVDI